MHLSTLNVNENKMDLACEYVDFKNRSRWKLKRLTIEKDPIIIINGQSDWRNQREFDILKKLDCSEIEWR